MKQPQPSRNLALVQLFAFTALPAMFALVALMGRPGSSVAGDNGTPGSPLLLYGLAALGLIGAVAWSRTKLRLDLEPLRFQTEMVVSLAFSELSACLGIVAGGMKDFATMLPFAVGTIAVNLLFIAPRVVAYWRR